MTNKDAANPPSVSVVIPAAGTGSRMHADIPKQYLRLCGKPILRHAIEKFFKINDVMQICVVIRECDLDLYNDAVSGLGNITYVVGSNERKLSVYNALKSFSNLKHKDKILIHDAARPCVNLSDICAVIDALDTHMAATLSHGVFDTVLDTDTGNSVDRHQLKAIQTPQGFHYGAIIAAHKKFENLPNFTDDAGLVAANGTPVHYVDGGRENIKVTTQEDIILADAILSAQACYETRTGQGFDVHAFDRGARVETVRLCGVDIEYPHPLKGHSDADVALHTVTDALFGAVGCGDIGQHFPPSDDQWKGKDSAFFLEKAVEMMAGMGGSLINVDLTVICEEPKVNPHRDVMRARLAQILGVDEGRVNVKATTTEKLGFTGRGEGIAAQAVVSVRLPTPISGGTHD